MTDHVAGKSVTFDLALRGGRGVDPAYVLLRVPLVQWARAVWLRSVPVGWMHRTWHHAVQAAASARSP